MGQGFTHVHRLEFAGMDEVVLHALDGTIVPLAAKEKLAEPEKSIGEGSPIH